MPEASPETAAPLHVGVHEAKTTLSRLLKLVEAGHEVIIDRGGIAVARLVPVSRTSRQFGTDVGLFEVPDNFDDPLPAEDLERFHR